MGEAAECRDHAFADFVGRVVACADRVRHKPRQRWRLGPLSLSLAGNDTGLLAVFRRGLALRPPGRVDDAGDSAQPERQRPLAIDLLVGEADGVAPPPEWPLPVRSADNLRRRHSDADVALSSWQEGAVWQVLDRRRGRAIYWARSRDAVPEWDLGAPFRSLLAWALEDEGFAMVHAAGFGRQGDAGLLLAGAGGTGKSSTSFVALREAGIGGIGDDFVALACDEVPRAVALFTTLKLDERALVRLSVPREAVANRQRPAGQKARIYQRELLPGSDRPSMPIAALAVPRVVASRESGHRPAGRAAVLRALAPSSLFLLPGQEARRFAALAAMTRRLPCYELALGSDPAGVAAMLQRLLDEVGHG